MHKLKVFGAKAWIVILPRNKKLDERAQETRMVGYGKNEYRLWNPLTEEIIIARDVQFDESQIRYEVKNVEIEMKCPIFYEDDQQKDKETIEEEENETEREKEVQNEVTTRSNRVIRKPQQLNDYELYTAFCLVAEEDDPKNYEEAISRDEGWEKAIEKELAAHKEMNTWTSTKLPGKKAIDAKWIFKIKKDGTKRK